MIYREPFSLRQRFIPANDNSQNTLITATSSKWFIFYRDKLLVFVNSDETLHLPESIPDSMGLNAENSLFMGQYGSINCYVTEAIYIPENEELIPLALRDLYGRIETDYFGLAGRAIQLLNHRKEHKFCGRCGSQMQDRTKESARQCPDCNSIYFPTLSPAVIMSVVDRDRILLGRAPKFAPGVYSTLAGFVEPGETLEEAVGREVREETGVEVGNVRYIASQPWPFPHSIMLGFSADYTAGDIVVNREELEDARWFRASDLPRLPSKITIARLLIDDFIQSCSA